MSELGEELAKGTEEMEENDEITEDSTDRTETLTASSELESTSLSSEQITSSSLEAGLSKAEDKGMETDDDVDENLDEVDSVENTNGTSADQIKKEDEKVKNTPCDNKENNKEKGSSEDMEIGKDCDVDKDIKKTITKEDVISDGQKEKESEKGRNDEKDNILKGDSSENDLNKSDKSDDTNKKEENIQTPVENELNSSTGEKEFASFLTQTPLDFEECEKGIIINDKDIIKPEDVFGRGKRAKTPKISNDYASEFDPDYDPSEETRGRKIGSTKKQTKQTESPLKTLETQTPVKRSRFPNLDIKALELPGEYGWRREIVVRNTFECNKKRPADVYYKPPTGKKLRSMVEVSSHLRQYQVKELTENNFSFIKTPISEPPFETVRNAGKTLGIGKRKPEIVIEKDGDEPAVPFNGTPAKNSPRGKKRKHSVGRPSKYAVLVDNLNKPIENGKDIPAFPEMQLQIKTEPVDPDEENEKEKKKEAVFPECPPTIEETRTSPSMSPPKKKSKATARKSTTQKSFKPAKTSPTGTNNKLDPLCNLHCPGLVGQPPTLQCNVCLCMFHPKCVNFDSGAESFICLRCINKACSPGAEGLMNVPSPALLNSVLSPPTTGSVVFTTTKSTLVPLNTFLANGSTPATKSSTIATVAPSTSVSTSSVAPVRIKKEPVEFDENSVTGGKASKDVIGNVRNYLERKATDINQNQSPRLFPLLKENLQTSSMLVPTTKPNLLFMPSGTLGLVPNTIQQTTHFGSIPSPMMQNTIPGAAVRPVISYPPLALSANHNKPSSTPQLSISSPVSLQPPRLTAAPGTRTPVPPTTPNMNGAKPDDSKQGQLLTLPPVVIKRLNLNQPVSLKINNTQVTVPPSSFLHTEQGLKLFLPKNTFPVNTGETAKLSVTVTNDKTLSLDTDNDMSGQLPTIVPNSSRTVTETPTDTKRSSRKYKSGINPANCFIQCLYGGFDCMLMIFEYLNVRDLFKVSSVCKTWRKIAMHQCLWKEVRLKNLKVTDWEKAAKYLSRRAVEILNLKGLCHGEDRNKTWQKLISVIHQFTCVHTIYFGTVPGSVLQTLCEKVPHLEVLAAEWISDFTNEQMKSDPTKLDIGKFSSLTNLRTLKLRGVGGLTLPAFSLSGGLNELKTLSNLKILSITTLKDVGSDPELEFLTSLPNLTQLVLGDCTSWTNQSYSVIGKLSQLTSLRLECGGSSYDTGLADALGALKKLENLELIEFLIAEDLYKTLQGLEKMKSLKIWPDTSSQPPSQVNSFALYTITRMKSLQKLEWGILSNTNSSIILDGEDSNKQKAQSNQEWIPFLPASDNTYDALSESLTEYISLSNFKEKLAKLLPKTKLNVFSKQTISSEEDDS